MVKDKHALVYGLGSVLIYSLVGNGKWKSVLPKVLLSFDNPVLISTVDYSIFQYAINLDHAKKEHPEFSTYEDLKQHAALYAFARAKSRSFLYEALLTEGEDPIEN